MLWKTLVRVSIFLFIVCIYLINISFAAIDDWGANLTLPLLTSDPPKLKGYRMGLFYQPPKLMWGHHQLYFEGSYAHWGLDETIDNRTINIYALAPYYRYYFFMMPSIQPYGEISIGLSYLTRTYIGKQNLGMHFAFQDQVAIGTFLGPEKKVFLSVGALHYSNASLCEHNRGMSIPLYFKLGYRF